MGILYESLNDNVILSFKYPYEDFKKVKENDRLLLLEKIDKHLKLLGEFEVYYKDENQVFPIYYTDKVGIELAKEYSLMRIDNIGNEVILIAYSDNEYEYDDFELVVELIENDFELFSYFIKRGEENVNYKRTNGTNKTKTRSNY